MRSTAFLSKAFKRGKASVTVAKPEPIDLTDLNKALEQTGDKIPDFAIQPPQEPVKQDDTPSWENLPGGLPPTCWV